LIIDRTKSFKTIILWIIISFITAHLCFIFLPKIFKTLNEQAIDWLFVLRSNIESLQPAYDDAIVHVDLNNTTIRQLNNFYLNRSYHARVIRNLSSMNVSSQLYDFIFAAPSDEKQDQALIDAVKQADNVYFGMSFQMGKAKNSYNNGYQGEFDYDYLKKTSWKIDVADNSLKLCAGSNPLITFYDLASVSKGLGFLSLKPDRDGVFRRMPLLVRYQNGYYPSFVLKAISDYLGVDPGNINVKPGKSIKLKKARRPGASASEDIVIPIDRNCEMIINFIGPWERMKHYNFVDVYRASDDQSEMALWKEEMAGKIVLVSEVSTGSADVGPVPTDHNFPLSGVHASGLHTILTGKFLREFTIQQMILVELFLLGIILLLSLRLSAVQFSLSTIAVAGCYTFLVALLFLYANIILNVIRPLLMIALALISIQIVSAIENAREYAKAEKAKEIAERELEIGRQIQSGFFPDVLPEFPNWEIAAYFKSSRQVAGDFYDVFPLMNGKQLGIVIADVCDKGVGAALFMALFRSLIRAFSIQNFDKQNSIDERSEHFVNNELCRTITLTNNYIATTHGEANMFATVFFGVLDLSESCLTYINCGHEPAVVIDQNTDLKYLSNTGPAIGVFPNLDFIAQKIQLKPGDILFAYTDGVIDAQNHNGDFFTKEQLLSLLTKNPRSAQELIDHINKELEKHTLNTEQYDDVTMLAVKRRPKL
jgi:serine phosphatase RsbU (regulator of sigma subunit)